MHHSFLLPFGPSAALLVAWLAAAAAAGCRFSGADGDGPLGGSHSVTGKLVDFQTGVDLVVSASLSTSGLLPDPEIVIDGSAFEVFGIPSNSAFQLLAAAPPSYRATYSPVITVGEDEVDGVTAPLLSEAFLTQLSTSFSIAPTDARGILLARVVDGDGRPKAGVAATSFALGGTGGSPARFLDASMASSPGATATSASGWVIFFEVETGVVSLTPVATANVTLEMATAPIKAGTVTIAEIKAVDGAPPRFSNVSFATQIIPIFTARGCVACHSGKGPGKDRGGLMLNGGTAKVYKELLVEDPTRVRVGMPEQSLLLTMPSLESPPDRHPNVTFTSATDPDFQKISVWIKEGAKEN